MIGRTEKVLISSVGRDGELVGRTRNFKEVFFVGSGVEASGNPSKDDGLKKTVSVGDLVDVKITGMKNWVLTGEIV